MATLNPTESLTLLYQTARRVPMTGDEHDEVRMAYQTVALALQHYQQAVAKLGAELEAARAEANPAEEAPSEAG